MVVNRCRNAVAEAVRSPGESILPPGYCVGEGRFAEGNVDFGGMRRPADVALDEDVAVIASEGRASTGDEGILAGAARADHEHDSARTDPADLAISHGVRQLGVRHDTPPGPMAGR